MLSRQPSADDTDNNNNNNRFYTAPYGRDVSTLALTEADREVGCLGRNDANWARDGTHVTQFQTDLET